MLQKEDFGCGMLYRMKGKNVRTPQKTYVLASYNQTYLSTKILIYECYIIVCQQHWKVTEYKTICDSLHKLQHNIFFGAKLCSHYTWCYRCIFKQRKFSAVIEFKNRLQIKMYNILKNACQKQPPTEMKGSNLNT